MINALWLFLIIPAAATLGIFLAALMSADSMENPKTSQEICHCRDCKFFEERPDPILEGDISFCKYHEHLMEESDFCSKGRRK